MEVGSLQTAATWIAALAPDIATGVRMLAPQLHRHRMVDAKSIILIALLLGRLALLQLCEASRATDGIWTAMVTE